MNHEKYMKIMTTLTTSYMIISIAWATDIIIEVTEAISTIAILIYTGILITTIIWLYNYYKEVKRIASN